VSHVALAPVHAPLPWASFDDAPFGSAVSTLEGGRLGRVNRAFGAMIGYAPEELEGQDWREVTHPDDVALSHATVVRPLITGDRRHASARKRYVHRDGHVVHAWITANTLRDENGEVKLWMQMYDLGALTRGAPAPAVTSPVEPGGRVVALARGEDADRDALVVMRSAIRQINSIRAELERPDVCAVPALADSYRRWLADLEAPFRPRVAP
jgi:PAS domain S-box-containing protein